MRKIARIGDPWSGVCNVCENRPGRAGVIIEGHPLATSCGSQVALIGHKVQATCGHIGTIIENGCRGVTCAGTKVALVGDGTTGEITGNIIDGCGNCLVGGC